MRPVLFAFHAPLVGEISFPAYFTLLTVGFGLAMILTVRESSRRPPDLLQWSMFDRQQFRRRKHSGRAPPHTPRLVSL